MCLSVIQQRCHENLEQQVQLRGPSTRKVDSGNLAALKSLNKTSAATWGSSVLDEGQMKEHNHKQAHLVITSGVPRKTILRRVSGGMSA